MSDWTEEALASLRAAHYTPRAWLTFLASSLRRARELRAVYPQAHRRLLALAGAGLAIWLAVGFTGELWFAAIGAAWWLVACAMTDWHLGLLDGDRLGAANTLTLLRAGAIPAVAVLGGAPAGVALFTAAGLSDVADGLLARARGETTRLGFWMDGSVDGLMLATVALAALPAWAAALVVGRYSAPWLVIGASYFLRAQRPSLERIVSGRIPGLVTFAGLTLALLGVPGAAYLVAAGALGGLGTFTASVFRAHAYAV
ncbi:MAG: CDP-alcohol phosphatidyltransferase family protein [Acidobacteriota bacterium]|nr:CDP-alcohol phosphatidyltransferase family protein [Acidobacteriota bacterium]